MQQDQTRQAQETAANFAQFQARQDEFQRQQQLLQHQQLLMQQQLMGFMQHVVTAIGIPLPQTSPQLAQPPTTSTTPAVQPIGLQSQGQPPAQFMSPPVQVSQWLASPGVAPQFTPYHTGFSPEQTSSLFVPESSVSRSLGASFSELTGMPTPPHMHAAGPSTAALAIMTTQRLPSSVASSDPTTDILAASQAAPAPAQTQTASAKLPASEGQSVQSSGSDDDGARFHLAPRTSAPDSSAAAPPSDP